jgi:hypothetical protein
MYIQPDILPQAHTDIHRQNVRAAILTECLRDVIEIEIGIESPVTGFRFRSRFRSRFALVPVSAFSKNNIQKAIESLTAMLNAIQLELLMFVLVSSAGILALKPRTKQ